MKHDLKYLGAFLDFWICLSLGRLFYWIGEKLIFRAVKIYALTIIEQLDESIKPAP